MTDDPDTTGPGQPPRPMFSRFPTVMTVILPLVTFGAFWLWWLYRVTGVTRAHLPDSRVPAALPGIAVVVWLVVIGRLLMVGPTDQADPVALLLGLSLTSVMIVWQLALRQDLDRLAARAAEAGARFDLVWTLVWVVVFSAVPYFQYTINRILDQRGR